MTSRLFAAASSVPSAMFNPAICKTAIFGISLVKTSLRRKHDGDQPRQRKKNSPQYQQRRAATLFNGAIDGVGRYGQHGLPGQSGSTPPCRRKLLRLHSAQKKDQPYLVRLYR